jgi:hypothetical protein
MDGHVWRLGLEDLAGNSNLVTMRTRLYQEAGNRNKLIQTHFAKHGEFALYWQALPPDRQQEFVWLQAPQLEVFAAPPFNMPNPAALQPSPPPVRRQPRGYEAAKAAAASAQLDLQEQDDLQQLEQERCTCGRAGSDMTHLPSCAVWG